MTPSPPIPQDDDITASKTIQKINNNAYRELEKQHVFKCTDKTKTHMSGMSKGRFDNIMEWPHNLQLGGHFVSNCFSQHGKTTLLFVQFSPNFTDKPPA